MSRTQRTVKRVKRNDDGFSAIEVVVGSDSQATYWNNDCRKSRKMKPYTKERVMFKYEVPHTPEYFRPKNFDFKEGIRNANRSMKKGVRQNWKKELRKELTELYNEAKTNL